MKTITISVGVGIVRLWFNMIVKQTWDTEPKVLGLKVHDDDALIRQLHNFFFSK